MKTLKKIHDDKQPMKITQKDSQCTIKTKTNMVPKTKTLSYGAIFQKMISNNLTLGNF
jgi:hypothetical protein